MASIQSRNGKYYLVYYYLDVDNKKNKNGKHSKLTKKQKRG